MGQKKGNPLPNMKMGIISQLTNKVEVKATTTGIDRIAISQIRVLYSQPRRYFDKDKLDSLARSIKEHGILEPLLVRHNNGNGRNSSNGNNSAPGTPVYELIAGERRLRAAEIAGLAEVPVVVLDLDDNDAAQIRLVENLQREDLNPLEETGGVLELLALRLEILSTEVIKLLQRMEHEEKGRVARNVTGNEKSLVVEQVFSSLGKMTWQSFVRNRLPLLKLPEDLLEVLREGKLEYTKVKAINKLKDKEARKNLLEVAIANNLSLNQIKEKIRELTLVEETSSPLKEHLNTTFRRLKSSNALDDPKKQARIEKLLGQLDKLLD